MKVSKQVVSSDSLFLNLPPSLSSSYPSRPYVLAPSLGISFPRREVTIVGRPDFPEKGTVTTTTGSFVYRPERIASCTQRTASLPRRLPRLVITRRFTDQRSITLARFRKCNRTPSWSDSRFFFHSTSGSAVLQVDKSARRIALHRFCPLLTEVAPFFVQAF